MTEKDSGYCADGVTQCLNELVYHISDVIQEYLTAHDRTEYVPSIKRGKGGTYQLMFRQTLPERAQSNDVAKLVPSSGGSTRTYLLSLLRTQSLIDEVVQSKLSNAPDSLRRELKIPAGTQLELKFNSADIELSHDWVSASFLISFLLQFKIYIEMPPTPSALEQLYTNLCTGGTFDMVELRRAAKSLGIQYGDLTGQQLCDAIRLRMAGKCIEASE
jgi:hypothetical protein